MSSAEDATRVFVRGTDTLFVSVRALTDPISFVEVCKAPTRFVLRDSSTMLLTDSTARGDYPLASGQTLRLASEFGYPRVYGMAQARRPALEFELASDRGLAVCVQRGKVPAVAGYRSIATPAERARLPQSLPNWIPPGVDRQLVLIPGSWFRRTVMAIPEGWESMTVEFIEYGEVSPERQATRRGLPLPGISDPHSLYPVKPSTQEARLRSPLPEDLEHGSPIGPLLYLDTADSATVRVLPRRAR